MLSLRKNWVYDPKFNFGKVSKKIEDAIKRRDLKAFTVNFFKFVANFVVYCSKGKKNESMEESYNKIEQFFGFYRNNVKIHSRNAKMDEVVVMNILNTCLDLS